MYDHNSRSLAHLKGQSLASDDTFQRDWNAIIISIQTDTSQQLTLEHIAKYCGCSQPTISLLKSRQQLNPSHNIGEGLIYLRQRISDCGGDQLKIKMLVTSVRGF